MPPIGPKAGQLLARRLDARPLVRVWAFPCIRGGISRFVGVVEHADDAGFVVTTTPTNRLQVPMPAGWREEEQLDPSLEIQVDGFRTFGVEVQFPDERDPFKQGVQHRC